jgi:phosphoglycolate phosphatase
MKPVMQYESIIWDWNGTLLDDAWLGVDIMDCMLKSRNMPGLSLERYREIFDFPVKDYYAKLGFDFASEPFELVGNEFIEKYNSRHFECRLRPFARETLQKINALGIRQFALSARNHQNLEEEFLFHGILDYFEHFSGLPDNWANGKISLGKALIDSQNILSSKTLLIGDTYHDYEVASALGPGCILIEGGHQSKNRLLKADAPVISHFDELFLLFG